MYCTSTAHLRTHLFLFLHSYRHTPLFSIASQVKTDYLSIYIQLSSDSIFQMDGEWISMSAGFNGHIPEDTRRSIEEAGGSNWVCLINWQTDLIGPLVGKGP